MTIPQGTAFAPFHWGALHLRAGHGQVNALMPVVLDPTSKQAELKAAAVRVEPLQATVTAGGGGARQRASTDRRLVVVGTGLAAMATVEALLEHDDADTWQITLVGREPELPYNRIMLSKLLAGTTTEAQLTLRRPQWLAEHGIEIRIGRDVRAVHRRRALIELDDGEEIAFDQLVLATGSRQALPALPGRDLRGVHPFRTLDDTRAIIESATLARRAVVIGGGLLGLEAARGLRARGVEVTVLHSSEWLMERQLDQRSAAMLERSLDGLEITVRLKAHAQALLGTGSVSGVELGDGEYLPADMVVIASGVTPEVSLARDAGLEVGRATIVDDELRTSAPGIYAVGECAQHRGVVYGLWAPLREQARVAAASLAGAPAAYRGSVPATSLKVAGIDLFCGGAPVPGAGDEEIVAMDTRRGRYRRLVLRDGRLVGAILLGDLRDAHTLREHLAGTQRVPETLLEPMPARITAPGTSFEDPGATVCTCMTVTRREITAAIGTHDLATVEEIGEHTRAGSGCGTCRTEIRALIDAHQQQKTETETESVRAAAG
jgi:ferredoxin-nitrate reductase